MPPTTLSLDRLERDQNAEVYDQLMHNPAFGERGGRAWLDLSRYADSNGYEEDEYRPHAYTCCDFVIWAMNANLPFDRFLQW